MNKISKKSLIPFSLSVLKCHSEVWIVCSSVKDWYVTSSSIIHGEYVQEKGVDLEERSEFFQLAKYMLNSNFMN